MLLKPMPLRRSHRAESGGIFSFSNGHCMKKLSHSEHLWKQGKIMVGGTHRLPRGTPIGCHMEPQQIVEPTW